MFAGHPMTNETCWDVTRTCESEAGAMPYSSPMSVTTCSSSNTKSNSSSVSLPPHAHFTVATTA